jgi:DNA-binding LacI/PurR family transcriptional regulator
MPAKSRRSSKPDPFDGLTEDWFRQNGVTEPEAAFQKWTTWLKRNHKKEDELKRKKVLQFASGLAYGSITHYLSSKTHKLSEWNLRKLEAIDKALGYRPPKRPKRELERPAGSPTRIALLTELTGLPSPSYHLEVIRALTRATSHGNYGMALHEVAGSLSDAVPRLLRAFWPDAAVLLRMTPTGKALGALADYSVPTVLVHADRYEYRSPPVLANIVPGQDTLEPELWKWVKGLLGNPGRPKAAAQKAQEGPVVVAMPHEGTDDNHSDRKPEFPRLTHLEPSIRNERIDSIMDTLAGFEPTLVTVDDYSFRHAKQVFQAHPDAAAYICLCDQIAVGIKHLAEATGQDYSPRILGFDDSELAHREGISSIGQQLDMIGQEAISKLSDWFRQMADPGATWPPFEMMEQPVHLVRRC